MKLSKTQLRRIIREEKSKLIREAFDELPENMDAEGKTIPQHQQLYTMLGDIAVYFLLKDQNDTGADIYDELMRRLDAQGLSTDVDNMLEEL